MRYQYYWRGLRLANVRWLVCDICYDKPNDNVVPKILPPDPIPVRNPRPENFAADNQGISAAQSAHPPAEFVPEEDE